MRFLYETFDVVEVEGLEFWALNSISRSRGVFTVTHSMRSAGCSVWTELDSGQNRDDCIIEVN